MVNASYLWRIEVWALAISNSLIKLLLIGKRLKKDLFAGLKDDTKFKSTSKSKQKASTLQHWHSLFF